ncbi:hypothetical protein [Parasphingorhabdus sp.]|uniref:hypothetical protein n=1 Tax=Parasphingorhabdus sp. TaxID=2709688 RepID=UPI0035945C47
MNHKSLAVRDDRQDQQAMPRPGVLSLITAALLAAIPLPAFAEADPSKNIAIALSGNIVGSPHGEGGARADVAESIADFSLSVSGPTDHRSPTAFFAITDQVPEHLSLFVCDLAKTGEGPAAFKDHDSGLAFKFAGLSSLEDSIEFSNDGGKSFSHVPTADSDGFDARITHKKFRPHGALLSTVGKYERFSISYRMKVK